MPGPAPFHGNINFHAQHSPMGAYLSFTCGNFASRGGFGVQLGRPGNQQLFIGVKEGPFGVAGRIRCLPFYDGATSQSAEAFTVGQSSGEKKPPSRMDPYRPEEIHRIYGWATDRWITPDFEFSIYTPFGSIPDPPKAQAGEMRDALLPAVIAELTVDNTNGEKEKTAFFAMSFSEAGAWAFDERLGFGHRRTVGVAGQVVGDVEAGNFQRWGLEPGLKDFNPLHQLGHTPGMRVSVPAGTKQTLRLALGVYLDGFVTTRLEGRYLYTRYFTSLADVLDEALKQFESIKQRCTDLDQQLSGSNLSPDQQFLIAHATRSYYGSTQLLEVAGEPFWVVNEGEYCMMNTLDLSVDHVFWELKRNPWVVRNLLDNFVRHYSYVDELSATGVSPVSSNHGRDARGTGGISFCHDMGVHNNFSKPGHSSYELPNLNAMCFSYMTCEELCNWVLMATSYVATTGDVDWAKRNHSIIDDCYQSLVARGGEIGFSQHDSSRCGPNGAEITTYDSLDHSLAQTRNNVYMAVKTWAAYLGIQRLYGSMGMIQTAYDRYNEPMQRAYGVAEAIWKQVTSEGTLPAVFESDNPGFRSRILPAIEGLLYPLFWRSIDTLKPHETFATLLDVLRTHTKSLLDDPEKRNFFPDGGIRLSSTSNNSWMSKIAIFQHIARKVFHLDTDPQIKEAFARADAAHVKWMTTGESAFWACSDQFVDGVAKGSKYYPRIITTALWME